VVAVGFIAWLGWFHGQRSAAVLTAILGVLCRAGAGRSPTATPTRPARPAQIKQVVYQLEGNAVSVGLMWVLG